MKVTICDKCGTIVHSEPNITNVKISGWYRRPNGISIDIIDEDLDYTQLCLNCFNEFLTYVTKEFPFKTTGHETDDRNWDDE